MTGPEGTKVGGFDDEHLAALAPLLEQMAGLEQQVRQLRGKVERADATATRTAQGLDEVETALADLAATAEGELARRDAAGAAAETDTTEAPATGPSGPEPLNMDTLADWIEQFLGGWFQRKWASPSAENGVRWCGQWFDHPEVISKLWALRLAWVEYSAQPGSALAVFYRDFFNPIMRELTDPAGPLGGCTPDRHKPREYITLAPRPWREQSAGRRPAAGE